MTEGTAYPSYNITSMSCGPSRDADFLSIPYLEPVPYEVYPDSGQKRIVITLFGVESASTWSRLSYRILRMMTSLPIFNSGSSWFRNM